MKSIRIMVGAMVALGACGGDDEPSNQIPVVAAVELTTPEDTEVTGTLEVSDPDGDELTISIDDPDHGEVSRDGTTLTYTPPADFHGEDSFVVRVSDGTEETAVTATVTVTPVNDAPVGVADSLATPEDTALVVNHSALLDNDTDVDGDSLSITAVANADSGTVSMTDTQVTFTPDADFEGAASFEYTVSDGTETAVVAVTVTVGGDNDAPVAVDDAATTDEDVPVAIAVTDLISNDTDADGQTLSVASVENPVNGTVALDSGTVTFTPGADFFGTASFEYTVSDGTLTDTGLVTVTVAPVNDNPTAMDDSATVAEDSGATAIDVLANDTFAPDAGETLTVTAVSDPAGGTATITVDEDGVTYTPDADFFGEDTFTYTISDGNGGTDTATVTVTVTNVNDAPVAVDDTATTPEDVADAIAATDLTSNDTDADGQTLTVVSVENPVNGTVTLDSGTVTFTPQADFFGTASFEYTVSDGTLTDSGLVTVTVTPVNDAPTATNDNATVAEDSGTTTIDVLANDSIAPDSGETLIVTAVSDPASGTATITVDEDGVTYTPDANFFGEDTFTYTISDGNGGTDTATVTITVTAVGGDAPVAVNDTATVRQNSGINLIAVLDNDSDPDGDSLQVTAVTEATSGSSGIQGGGAGVTYAPDTDFFGQDSFTYTISDGNGGSDTATVTITVTACGDGTTQADHGEECDDANADETDGCTSECVAGVVCKATEEKLANGDLFAVDPATGHCYAAFNDATDSFDDAQQDCVNLNGFLTTITSAEEDGIVLSVHDTAQTPWIGAVSPGSNAFAWVTGESFVYDNYASLEPSVGGTRECLHLSNTSGEWADTTCTASSALGYICELAPVPCGDGVIHPLNGEECDGGTDCDALCQLTEGCGDGDLDVDEECDDDNLEDGDTCSALCQIEEPFFSEYVEGSSFNKALEIYNPLSTTFNLEQCSVRLYSNGSSTPSNTLALTGTIAAGEVLVLCHPSIDPAISTECDVTSSAVINFDGNDAVDLVCDGFTFDVIGQIGVDPGAAWGTSPTTSESTLRRMCGITSGDEDGSDVFDPADEWVGFAQDTFDGLGDPTCAP